MLAPPNRVDVPIDPDSPVTDRFRRTNELIVESLAAGREQPTSLFCECGDAGCYRVVLLTPAVYEAARQDRQWLAISSEHAR